MTHKAFEHIGKRVLIVDPTHRNKEGIFQESEDYFTMAEGTPRPALDFIEPKYDTSPLLEILARISFLGFDPFERIHPENPLLSFHFGVDHLKLQYSGQRNGTHVFEGKLIYAGGTFVNDGNFEVFDRYKDALRAAGFDIK
jgi:hypothetical protein